MTPFPRLRFLMATATLACAAASAPAQPRAPQTPSGTGTSMLVLDASGSMWGQIDGRAKIEIEIARQAVADMLAGWPAQQAIGLMAYGHRTKGRCDDIELLKAPAAPDKAALQQAVNALQPKGMTPISASVRMAAEQLRFTEQKATVILISDGEETCQADPCALGQELEKLGVDFTAHVIGFDIARGSPAEKQLRCLATSTGGRYLDAGNAASLSAALQAVAKAPPPAPPAPTVKTTTGREWLPDVQLWWEAGSQIDGARHERDDELGVREMTLSQTARDCQALCLQHPACGAWVFNPPGSYFIDHPRCELKGLGGALRPERMEKGDGWVSGVKPGAAVMLNAP